MKYIIAIFAIVFYSCDKSSPDCFKKAGVESSLTRDLAPFTKITLESNVELILRQSSEYKAEILGPKNLLDKVETSVSDGVLKIDNHNACNFVRGYKHHLHVIVYAPLYDMVTSNSIGNIKTEEGFVQDSIFFYTEGGDVIVNGNFKTLKTGSHGNGNVYFYGATDKMYVYMNGTNYLYAETATIKNYVFIENISLADAYITAPSGGTLEYHIWKTGNIYYKGDPAVVAGKSEKTGVAIKD